MTPTPRAPILAAGRTCWALVAADASGLLIDARSYYRAFCAAARSARRSILLAGWRFSSSHHLLRGRDAAQAGTQATLLPFLRALCAANPELRIHVLAWDFSFNYALEWELFQNGTFQRGPDDPIQFRFDDQHCIGGSHHQKFVVIDGRLGFVGGIDFCDNGWDDRRDQADHPEQADDDAPTTPYHDVQAYLTGPAAAELACYFSERWQRATGESLELPPPDTAERSLPFKPTVRLGAGPVALCRNQPATLADPDAVLNIRQLYLDAIASAERLIYIENQYFSARAVHEALLARLRDTQRPRLDLVLVLPRQLISWVEAVAVGGPRLLMLEQLRAVAAAFGHRLGLYDTVATAADGRDVPVLIHSKLLLVDDRFLTVGSCNLSNRSMGLDTELNVAWEAIGPYERAVTQAIRRARVNLLAEHCGLPRTLEPRRRLRRTTGLVAELDRIAAAAHSRLRRLTPEAIVADRAWLARLAEWHVAFDPERPVIDETLHELVRLDPTALVRQGLVWYRDWLQRPDAPGASS